MDGLNSIWSRKARFDGPDAKGAKKVPKAMSQKKIRVQPTKHNTLTFFIL